MKHLVTILLLTFIIACQATGSATQDIPGSSCSISNKSFEKAGDDLASHVHHFLHRVVHSRQSLFPYRHIYTINALLNRLDAKFTPASIKDENDLANSYLFYRSINLQLIFPYHYFW